MIVVSDTSPLLSLALIGQLDLLRQLYGSIVIPSAVHDEIVVGGAVYAGGGDVARQEWIHIDHAMNAIIIALLMRELDQGEAEAIALAIELKADLLLVDEHRARRMADYLSLPHTGLIDILGEAKRRHYLTAIKPALDDLIARANFHVGRKLYQRTLESTGELDHVNPA